MDVGLSGGEAQALNPDSLLNAIHKEKKVMTMFCSSKPRLLCVREAHLFVALILLLIGCSSLAVSADGLFIAVGGGGRILTSRDGATWDKVNEWDNKWADDSNLLHSAAAGLGKIVVAGGGGWTRETQAGHILVSNDGKEWRDVAKYPQRVIPVLFHGERFVAGGSNGLLWSTDGEKWNVGVTPDELKAKRAAASATPMKGVNFRKGAAGNGIFLITGDADGKVSWSVTTRDGKSIESFTVGSPPVGGVAFGAGKFLIAGRDGVFTSTDALKWNREENAPADELWRVEWSGSEFITSGKKGSYRSADGTAWKPFGKKAPGWIAAAGPHGYVALNWGANLSFSLDGEKWTPATQPSAARQMEKVIYVEQPRKTE